MANKSIESNVIEYCGNLLRKVGIKRYYLQQDSINNEINTALADAPSKSGGNGGNRPDISFMFDNQFGRYIPVMIEAKGTAGKLEKLNPEGNPLLNNKNGKENYNVISQFAANGAIHYANAVLNGATYKEAIAIGINGSELDECGEVADFEVAAYYISKRNHQVPKKISALDNTFIMFSTRNSSKLCEILDKLNLTDLEIEALKAQEEATLEDRVKKIHQRIYDDDKLKTLLGTNDKLYLFCGLIMAGLSVEGVKTLDIEDFNGDDDLASNDGQIILQHIKTFLRKKDCSNDKINMILSLVSPVFEKEAMWKPHSGESILKDIFKQVKEDIIPCLETDLHLDFMGKILNSLSDWVHIENDMDNDVVLTPRYITSFMARLARTDMNSYVCDRAMGSGGFLVSAMDIMIRDAQKHILDAKELEEKINHIKTKQIFGVEILGNIYILSVLNMILMGDGSSNMINGDSHDLTPDENSFPATVFLLNPPYSAPGKGFNFVEETLKLMTSGYACILIQENAGMGQGLPFTKLILEKNTLLASIRMPAKLFYGKSGVQTAIYVFQVARPHEKDDLVKFIDMSEDGYTRQNRRKSTQAVNLRDTDDAAGRYAEVEAIVLGKKPKTSYYTKENGLYIEDTISLNGNDWAFAQHKEFDTTPTEDDFKKSVFNYLTWKINSNMEESDT